MRDYMYIAVIAAATVLEPPLVPKGRCRHQLDFSGTTGSVVVEIDFGSGYRTITTVDCTDTARLPFCFECAVTKIRVTPSVSRTLAYYVNQVD